MPSRERVQDLVAYVEQRRFMDAMREFYHEETALQENDEVPRLGLAANLEREAAFLAAVEKFHEVSARSVLIDGDWVAIRWNLDVSMKSGVRVLRDEVALQRWEGDKVICERFFYDPKATAAPARGQ